VIVEMSVPAKAEPSIICSDAGRQTEFNDAQSESAFASIRVSFDPDSNVNDESNSHQLKEHFPRVSTEAGRQTDSNESQDMNADDSIRVSFDSDSNVNAESE
jgi:hypothetical protein